MHRLIRFTVIALILAATPLRAAVTAVPPQIGGERMPSLAPMLKNVIPTVVNISTEGTVAVRDPFFGDPFFSNPEFRRRFGLPSMPRMRRTRSLGSGVIIDADKGYIVTNNHVIARAHTITVTLRDGRRYKAKLVGADPGSDIAVIRIDAPRLKAIRMGDSGKLRVGDFVVAIGNPFGLGQSVTSGIVSGLGRTGLGIEGYENFIQTDASINPGNSGGALVNLRGELVGINTAILSRSGGNIGIGFAIPVNMARKIIAQLIEHGNVRRGFLGVHIQDLTSDLASAFGLDTRIGAVVARVVPGSAAEKAGIKVGDVITEINGKKVTSSAMLRNSIGLLRVGSKLRLKIYRNGRYIEVEAVLKAPRTVTARADILHPSLTGATLTDEYDTARYRGVRGVLVKDVRPGSPAWRAGLRSDDIIVMANRRRVRSMAELERALRGKRQLLLNIRRGDGALFILIR